MALATDKVIFLHIPKCAGQFIRRMFKICKIKHEELGDRHSYFPDIELLKPPEFFERRLLFAFVRHPLTWYQSRWAFRVKTGWEAWHPLDYHCSSNDFRTFVRNALAYKPDGWFSSECRNFIDVSSRPVDFVGRTENLIEDLIKVLEMAGEQFNPKLIKKYPRVNDSNMGGRPSKYWATYDEELMQRVLATESEVINRYYRGFKHGVRCSPCPY